ncbi:hypothetical protein BDP27DRAFT_1312788 [Rhodocollybia butyracea]|uniref:T6SS Phospholipase effector Tle1-like catalytic domain-containing protein n=1 Tax=Rhodocollybia butyracea TaxID=206335 RepID=A0A9P5Q8L1_9AGAR|nr:hypothetical protein BDP27DRAFT_1312788 [Rhodocollybia butyracea]
MSASPNGDHTRDTTMVSVMSADTMMASPVSPTSSAITKASSQDSKTAAMPGILPPSHPFRTLVLCFDGTGDQFDSDNSNIVQFFTALKKDDSGQQMVYYQAGIGTYTSPEIATPGMAKFSKTVDMAIAWYLDAHVMGGYEFLMQNYNVGDRICIFGFSRGAYTARSLAGMVHKVGVLPACNHQQVPFAYKMYSRNDDLGHKQAAAFKAAFSVTANIEIVGVFDTVNSVGLFPNRLPFTTSNTTVKTFRHALSLDEHRAKFKANLWNPPADHRAKREEATATHSRKHSYTNPFHRTSREKLEDRYYKAPDAITDIEEVWFSGCHCDVGGGSVSNEETTNLARIPLRWMIRECFKTNTGILFHADCLSSLGLNPDALWPEVHPRPPPLSVSGVHIKPIPRSSAPTSGTATQSSVFKTEEELELEDAMSPIYDQLKLVLPWWILEFIPVKNKYHNGKGSHKTEIGLNLGRARKIPRQKANGVKVHRSVKMRMDAGYEDGKKYTPRAKFDFKHVTWVD